MKTVVVTALILLLLIFLLPLLLFGAVPLSPLASPAATLPPDPGLAPLPTAARADALCTVRIAMESGEVIPLTMEEYLWRVVAAEMPASFEPEALKAQAVAARTFAYSRMGNTIENHPDADLCTDSTCCQAYIDPDAAAVNWGEGADTFALKISAAVADTDGMVILYNGQPIEAVFHSSSAGRTLDAVEVWGNAVPYLTGVDSPEGEEVPNYHTAAVFTPEQFKSTFLDQYPDAKLSGDPAKWFGAVTHSSNGGVTTIEIGGVTVSGTSVRKLYSLRSTAFSVTADKTVVTFAVTGYGHGVGMSQYGANALAKEGKTYPEIVSWYYTGVTIGQYP
ncbi:MAG: stage II sporulation protein D [Clostridia bacterium]|nr:stage II sporulation protein D [Clostridia bacterium]